MYLFPKSEFVLFQLNACLLDLIVAAFLPINNFDPRNIALVTNLLKFLRFLARTKRLLNSKFLETQTLEMRSLNFVL